jgi:SAM-dependent methyltransferase
MPRAGEYLKKEELSKPEISYPLDVYFCKSCTSVQLLDVIPREVLFEDYRYLSSVASKSVIEHFEAYAKEIKERFFKSNGLVVEIACNDGILLKPLCDIGVRAIGVDPAVNIVKVAKERGLEVINDYFGEKCARKIESEYGKADVIIANAVYAHIDDMEDITKGTATLLKESGSFIFEVHHLADIIETLQYDSIYHEHMSYHSVFALSKFLKKYGMEIFDVKRFSVRGGMIRVYAKKIGNNEEQLNTSVKDILGKEKNLKLEQFETYKEFAKKVEQHKHLITAMLKKLKNEGKKIVAYGMSGRGNTLLNYWKIGTDIIDYGIDESPERHGRYVPGMHIPIVSPKGALGGVDYALLLAWIFEKDIIKKEQDFIKNGGKFIIPLPYPHFAP